LQTASAVDGPRQIEILYHWALDSVGLIISVRTRIDRNQPEIASITDICPAAHWIEREMWELMGISFQGHPDLRHLLLTDDWPKGKFPLRRDFRKE
jgi:NADH-quinone oxidoreductase subunit C